MNASIKLGLSSLLLVAGGLAYVPEALAQTGPLRNSGTGRCLGVNTTTLAAISATCNGSSNQAWVQTAVASGVYLLRNVQTGRCLDSNSAGATFVSVCNSAANNQRWTRLTVSGTTARFRSNSTLRFLNSSSTGAINTAAATGTPLQNWTY
jgi:hypothetical protein